MKKQQWKTVMVGISMSALLLVGCAEDEKENVTEQEQQPVEEAAPSTGGLGTMLEDIPDLTEAEVPAEEKEELLTDFQQYIDTFNNEDVEGYMNTLSNEPLNFNYEEQRTVVTQIFDSVDSERVAENVKIINFQGEKADIYAELSAKTVVPDTEESAERSGKQLTIMHKTDDGWKVSAIFFQPDEE
ncbi:hypothetical protein [Bacillus sp. 2205SS5-2]|uniref:hypothetical protein n=1 Tax=Bacillus sp. 2205SS5-2 TaxID=3109031 RepID=UPI0030050C8E